MQKEKAVARIYDSLGRSMRSHFSQRNALFAAVLLSAVLPVGSPLSASSVEMRDGTDANSHRTMAAEKLALKILQAPAVRKASEAGLVRYLASEQAKKPDGGRYAKSSIDDVATLAALYTALGAVPEPTFGWVFASPRRWHGYTIAGSRWYADNVDTIYRAARVDTQSNYEVTLHPAKSLPAQLSVMLYDQLMYENGVSENLEIPPGSLEITENTPRNPDGSITLTFGPEPANRRVNYLQLKPGVKQIFVREIRGDWTLPPVRLSIKRTQGTPPPARTIDDLAGEAATYIASAVHGTVNLEVVFGRIFDNKLSPPRIRWIENDGTGKQKLVTDEALGPDKVLGFMSGGLFNIKDDEALVMTLNMMGTKYLSVNSYRPFYLSPEHVNRTSSLNNYQSKANPDGSFTFVFAQSDPGVHNWIDSSGIPFGSISVRWQTLTHPVSATLANGVKEVRVVKLADLRKELPPSTKWVTPNERAAQRAERAEQFKLRCLGTPCEVGGKLDRMY